MALSAAVLFSGSFSFAGAANVDMKCKSKTGLTIEGHVPGDMADFDITIKQGGKVTRLHSDYGAENLAEIFVFEELPEGVWTLLVNVKSEVGYAFIRMYALPKTVKFKNNRYGTGWNASFTAKAHYAHGSSGDSKESTLVCTLSYSL